mmetsp:Transcript_15249/g.38221  ORF Transcript_15249/g.38221 Transcript_15249/m.38221 type:complete len:370 (-) Transcript_15249:775-1884(-)
MPARIASPRYSITMAPAGRAARANSPHPWMPLLPNVIAERSITWLIRSRSAWLMPLRLPTIEVVAVVGPAGGSDDAPEASPSSGPLPTEGAAGPPSTSPTRGISASSASSSLPPHEGPPLASAAHSSGVQARECGSAVGGWRTGPQPTSMGVARTKAVLPSRTRLSASRGPTDVEGGPLSPYLRRICLHSTHMQPSRWWRRPLPPGLLLACRPAPPTEAALAAAAATIARRRIPATPPPPPAPCPRPGGIPASQSPMHCESSPSRILLFHFLLAALPASFSNSVGVTVDPPAMATIWVMRSKTPRSAPHITSTLPARSPSASDAPPAAGGAAFSAENFSRAAAEGASPSAVTHSSVSPTSSSQCRSPSS